MTCLLADRITDRVISVASATYLFARLHLEDLNWNRRTYSKWRAYGESELANLLFVAALAGRGVRAYAARLMHAPAQGARATLQARGCGRRRWIR